MKAKWIWVNQDIGTDAYAEFIFDVNTSSEDLIFKIGVDTDYALFINDELINCDIYQSYPNEAILDTLNLKIKPGLNKFKILVYYNGESGFMNYSKGSPGLYFVLSEKGKIVLVSDENIYSKKSDKYLSNCHKKITLQLGYRVFYDFTKKENEYHPSVIVNKNVQLRDRPNEKCLLLGRSESIILKDNSTNYLIDTKQENVGYIDFDLESNLEQNINISFGEHIVDGGVRRLIDGRDFSFEFHLQKGKNVLTVPLIRIGARYLEITAESPLKINYLGILRTEYPFKLKPYLFDNDLDLKIYETAIYTLKCCYHEHYEDCPWREQGLYTLDSRFEMLAAYYAFDNFETMTSSIELMINDKSNNGQLSMCFPCDLSLHIPSFTLHFFTLLKENYLYTHNLQLIKLANDKLDEIINAFFANMKNGLVQEFEGEWNFYEWINGYDGNSDISIKNDIIINLLFVNALNIKTWINSLLNIDISYDEQVKNISKRINEEFFDEEKNLYYFSNELKKYSVLLNSLAIVYDVAPQNKQKIILDNLLNNTDVDWPSLSMKSFLYDAILKVDPDNKDWIINEIRKTYKKMLDDGATTFYETELGEKDFHNAGSLCHGWSSSIIYYYNILGLNKKF